MHLYGIFNLMRVMRKWGHPQLAVCPRFPWQNQMCVPDLHLLQTHINTDALTCIIAAAEPNQVSAVRLLRNSSP